MWSMTRMLMAFLLLVVLLGMGCEQQRAVRSSRMPQLQPLEQVLVLPGEALVLAWPSAAAEHLNHRRNAQLGADRLPVSAEVNASQVRVWDQQWILNGRAKDTYVRTTQSIQRRDLR